MKPTFFSLILSAVAILALSGCYHTNIITGKPASGTVVEEEWATSLINGLVPPEDMSVAAECPNGVAQVETRHSFLNMLAAGITFGIYTPMHLKVTCAAAAGTASLEAEQQRAVAARAATPEAAGMPEVVVPEAATAQERTERFSRAVAQSAKAGRPVQVRFE